MGQAQLYEGTLDEIVVRYGQELSGKRLKVIVDDTHTVGNEEPAVPFYVTATPKDWAEALRNWAASHDPDTPLLSNESIDRESIYDSSRPQEVLAPNLTP